MNAPISRHTERSGQERIGTGGEKREGVGRLRLPAGGSSSTAGTPTIEADSLSSAEMVPTMLEFFDSLSPGESFVFASSESPAWLLAVLRAGRRGQFDWTLLDDGGEIFHVEITRRSADRGSLRRISDALGWDHDRLARLEVSAFVARAGGDRETARKWYEAFSSGLRRHIAVEEELLFPVFEERAGLFDGSGPTEIMRTEHREILRLLGEILRTIGDPAKLPDQARAEFHEILEEHHRKEEGMLYPALDEVLTPEEGDALVSRIQGFAG
jgi:regulator of cell morphogenesis and NO signaling